MAGITQIDPLAPTRAPNSTAQVVVTILSWAIVAAGLAWALRDARRSRTWLPIGVILAVSIGVINEPLFDKVFHLYFYDDGKQWTWLNTFGYPQPNWTMSAYIIIYAFPTLFLLKRFATGGVTRRWLLRYFAGCSIFVGAFEAIAINLGTYQYYAFEPFRVLKYPLWLGVMEGAHVVIFSLLVTVFASAIAKGWKPLLTLPMFLISFCSVMFGAGFPGLAVLNAHPVAKVLVYLGTVASMILAGSMVWFASLALPSERRRTDAVPTFLRSLADRLTPPERAAVPAQPAAERAEDPPVTAGV